MNIYKLTLEINFCTSLKSYYKAQVFAAAALGISRSVFCWRLQAFDSLLAPALMGFSPKLTSSTGLMLFQDVKENMPLSYAKFRDT